jgi:uncharacterized membrane protein
MKMVNLEFNILIDRPVSQVFAFMTDLSNLPRWQSMVKQISQASKGPVGLGTTFSFKNEVLGRQMEGMMEVTEFEQDAKFGYKGKSGPMTIHAMVTFKTVGTGTKLTLSAQADPAGLFKVAEGVLAGQIKSQMEGNLATLKSILES